MADIGGYAGKTLRINLNDGKVTEEIYDEAFLRKYLGGTALGVKLLYDEVPRDIEYDDPRNMYFIGTGPLSGTVIGGSGIISVVTKGALTGGATSCQANGLFAAYLKFSGYDNIILTGKTPEWSYISIRNGKVEIKDASGIMGLDTYETTDRLLELHGVKNRGEASYPSAQRGRKNPGGPGHSLTRGTARAIMAPAESWVARK